MPAEIVTGRFCANFFSAFEVPGSTDETGSVLLVIRKFDGSVEVYLNGHLQGEIEEPSAG